MVYVNSPTLPPKTMQKKLHNAKEESEATTNALPVQNRKHPP
jgi:hypothetical protein